MAKKGGNKNPSTRSNSNKEELIALDMKSISDKNKERMGKNINRSPSPMKARRKGTKVSPEKKTADNVIARRKGTKVVDEKKVEEEEEEEEGEKEIEEERVVEMIRSTLTPAGKVCYSCEDCYYKTGHKSSFKRHR